MRLASKVTDRWAAGRNIGIAAETSHAGYHEKFGLTIEWKRGPRGQGWHYRFGNSMPKGCYATSEEAHRKALYWAEKALVTA